VSGTGVDPDGSAHREPSFGLGADGAMILNIELPEELTSRLEAAGSQPDEASR
jgi:hypothetical protein